jgi:hypothetical protein
VTVATWLQGALDHAGNVYTLGDVVEMIQAGDAQLWRGERSAIVTRIEKHPREHWLLLWLAGGDLAELRDVIRPQAEAWGVAQGCAKSVIVGRSGWSKALAREGYEPLAMVVGKVLSK